SLDASNTTITFDEIDGFESLRLDLGCYGVEVPKQLEKFVSRMLDHDCYGSDQESDEVSQYLPNSLRFLRWSGYLFWSFLKTFTANNLVGLELHDSNIVQLWEGGDEKEFKFFISSELNMLAKSGNLRSLKLSNLKLRVLDLGITLNLVELILEDCKYLVELHMLAEKLILEDCNGLVELYMPASCLSLISLGISYTIFRNLDLRITLNLKTLSLKDYHDLIEHMLSECPQLISLGHSKLRTLHLWNTQNLLEDLVELHMPFECPKLVSLELSFLKLKTLDLRLTPTLEMLSLKCCDDLVELHKPTECLNLRYLTLSDLKLLKTLDLGITPNLEMLSFRYCHNLAKLHMATECQNLRSFELVCLKLTTFYFGMTPNLVELILSLDPIKYLPDSICILKHLKSLKLPLCDVLEKLPEDIGR
nr:hypothetical protein [Tanacetum cinerariifolium]